MVIRQYFNVQTLIQKTSKLYSLFEIQSMWDFSNSQRNGPNFTIDPLHRTEVMIKMNTDLITLMINA